MALSGSISKTFTNNSMITATLSWTATQNIPSNNSSVTASLKLKSNSTYAPVPTWNGVTATITINGNSDSSSINSYVAGGATSGTKYSRTVTVPHNADGTKTFNFGFSINFGDVSWNGARIGTVSHSGSGTLNTIPRASSIASIVGNQIGGNVTVNITRASSSFKHIVKYTNTAGNVVTVGENVDTSKTFTISMNDCSHLPNSTSGTAKITVDTYSGNSKIGSVTSNHTVYVPDSVKPTFEWVRIKELNDSIKSLNLGENRFVQGKSNLHLQVHGTAQYGATINKASVGITHVHTIQSHIGSISLANFPWAVGENLQLVGTITDSRGRSASGSIAFTILPFSNPVIHSFSASRIDNGTSISVFKRISVSRVDVNKTEYAVYVDRKINGGWTQIHSEYSTNVETITLNGFDTSTSHEIRLRVNDYFQSVSSMTTISTSKTLMDFNKDIGVGIGKVHEKGALDVGGDTYIKGYTTLTAGSTNGSGNDVMLHLNRTNTTPVAVFASNGTVGDFAMNLYNQTGAWTRAHLFKHSGRVELNGELSVGGEITSNGRPIRASEFYANGARVHADWTPPELWTGATYLGENQTANPSKSLANCRNGWMLVWSDYTDGVANNYDWVFTPIPKSAVSAGVNGMHAIVANSNAHNALMLSKYIYVGTGTSIIGSKNNTLPGLDNVVLRKVYEW